MGFLDNLENSLKTLESREERDPSAARRKQDERASALAVLPWAEKLRESGYTKNLLEQVAIAGHRLRTKIYMSWLENVLRLEARQRKLELRPTPNGIVAVFIEANGEEKTQPIDLDGDPARLLLTWLGPLL
jgi:hypothetical protein